MSYHAAIHAEDEYIKSVEVTATEDALSGFYNAILGHWFTSNDGYIMERQVLDGGDNPEYIIYSHAKGNCNTMTVVGLELSTGSNDNTLTDVKRYMQKRLPDTEYNTIYSMACIGPCWSVWRMEKGKAMVTNLQTWYGDVTSDRSYKQFEKVFNIIHTST
jgi:hypothetical protein